MLNTIRCCCAQVLSSMPGVEVMGLEQRDQHDGSRSIDIVARYKGQLLAVEVDGPYHFTWPGQHLTGITLARNRALEQRGYRLMSVPVTSGWEHQRGQQQRQQYLQALLDGQPITATSSSDTATSPISGSSSSSSSLPAPAQATGPTIRPIVAGAPGLLARPQRPLQPGRPAKKRL
jgi:hypothetical protein